MIAWLDEDNQEHRGSLFATFAALAQGEAWSFPALRPHQFVPWHAFTVQVAALALIYAKTDALPIDEDAWRDLLSRLTPGCSDTAWDLVVDDWCKPALLQPPVATPENRAAYKNRLFTPDALDMLVTAKNHELKQERMADASAEQWLFALVTLQTTEGFLGAGNYGISRMNGGFATRMSLGIHPSGNNAAAAFRRDVLRLVADAQARPDRRSGTPLLWTKPWDGTASLDFNDLDELYVEVCRRVRLGRDASGEIEALAAGSKVARVAAKDLNGKTQDPWAPLKADGSSSHTPSGAGFGYRQMARLLDRGEIIRPLLAEPHEDDDRENLSIVASAMVRGQGKTEGLHRRAVRISRMEELADGERAPLDRIGAVAGKRSVEAGDASRRLRRALISLVQGGPEQARLDDDDAKRKAERWLSMFDEAVDEAFFAPPFWSEAAGDEVNHRLEWRRRLNVIAHRVFAAAEESAPRTEMRRIKAKARARALLHWEMDKWMKEVAYGE